MIFREHVPSDIAEKQPRTRFKRFRRWDSRPCQGKKTVSSTTCSFIQQTSTWRYTFGCQWNSFNRPHQLCKQINIYIILTSFSAFLNFFFFKLIKLKRSVEQRNSYSYVYIFHHSIRVSNRLSNCSTSSRIRFRG